MDHSINDFTSLIVNMKGSMNDYTLYSLNCKNGQLYQ